MQTYEQANIEKHANFETSYMHTVGILATALTINDPQCETQG